jgi:hypothetical protein
VWIHIESEPWQSSAGVHFGLSEMKERKHGGKNDSIWVVSKEKNFTLDANFLPIDDKGI